MVHGLIEVTKEQALPRFYAERNIGCLGTWKVIDRETGRNIGRGILNEHKARKIAAYNNKDWRELSRLKSLETN